MDSRGRLRRRLLRSAAIAAGSAWAGACAPGRPDWPVPHIDPANVTGAWAGLRPFRRAGVRLEAEDHDGRLLIHHYGHGGCGVTLSWGTAAEVVAIARGHPSRRAAVLGAGAVGLATARLLQAAGFSVQLWTREGPETTVSARAGGLWAPSFLLEPGEQTPGRGRQLGQALRIAYRHFTELPAARYGVRVIPVYALYDSPTLPLSWEWGQAPELFKSVMHAPGEHPFGSRYVHEFRLPMVSMPIYLTAVVEDFIAAGGELLRTDFQSPAEVLALDAPVLINCLGLGAASLFADALLEPIRGQLVRVAPQPAINYAVLDGTAGLYLLPRPDGLLLGGTHERGDWSSASDPATTSRLIRAHQRLYAG